VEIPPGALAPPLGPPASKRGMPTRVHSVVLHQPSLLARGCVQPSSAPRQLSPRPAVPRLHPTATSRPAQHLVCCCPLLRTNAPDCPPAPRATLGTCPPYARQLHSARVHCTALDCSRQLSIAPNGVCEALSSPPPGLRQFSGSLALTQSAPHLLCPPRLAQSLLRDRLLREAQWPPPICNARAGAARLPPCRASRHSVRVPPRPIASCVTPDGHRL